MYLAEIKIRNFRLFKNFDLKLNRGLNILVGENDSGKTALIDAIRYVLGTNSSDRIYLEENDFFGESNSLSIQLEFENVEQYAHIFVEHLTHEKFTDSYGVSKRRPVLYVQLAAEKTGQEKRGYPVINRTIKSGRDGNGPLLESEIQRFLSTTYLKPLRDAEAELASGKGSRLSQILGASIQSKPDSINDILTLIAKANTGLLKEGGHISKASTKIKSSYLDHLIFEEDKKILNAIIDLAGVQEKDIECAK